MSKALKMLDSWIGLVGAVLLLSALIMAAFGINSKIPAVYWIMNIVGAICLVVDCWRKPYWPGFWTNMGWAVFSTWGLVRLFG